MSRDTAAHSFNAVMEFNLAHLWVDLSYSAQPTGKQHFRGGKEKKICVC